MSCCEGTSGGLDRYPGTGCCGTSCAGGKTGCSASEPRIRSCLCQENVGCLDQADCGGFRPRGTAATGACPGPCQCAEEEAWNRNVPPKPNCEWLSNFSELRRQWSDHGRQNNCKCCNCKPCRTAAPCKPCLTPPPVCSTTNFCGEEYQPCCNDRLSGGACGGKTSRHNFSPSDRQDRSSGGGCQSNDCVRPIIPSCSTTPISNMYGCGSAPCSVPSECSVRNSRTTCRPPSSCQPCSPSPRAVQQDRSCCQCITGSCMCQPMPRTCNCPAPVQVDARAEHECSCDCPSSPECACPPSERRFARTKVKCPNARLCCPTPRPRPGPKCDCLKCQPCLPPPCDSCTASKCRGAVPNVKPCCGDSSFDDSASCRTSAIPCQPVAPPCTPAPPCQPAPTCADCRSTPPPCRSSGRSCVSAPTSVSRPRSGRFIRLLNRNRSPASTRSTGATAKHHAPADEGFGDDDGEADSGLRESQCHCGSSGSRGCHEQCDFCCSENCDESFNHVKKDFRDLKKLTKLHVRVNDESLGFDEKRDRRDNAGYDADDSDDPREIDVPIDDKIGSIQCRCGTNEKTCDDSCDYCCSVNCNVEQSKIGNAIDATKIERIVGGGTKFLNDVNDNNDNDNSFSTISGSKCPTDFFDVRTDCTREGSRSATMSRSSHDRPISDLRTNDETYFGICNNGEIGVASDIGKVASIAKNSTSPRGLLRSIIGGKCPIRHSNG